MSLPIVPAHPRASIPDHRSQREALRRIIAAYDDPVVRAYCHIRFQIININMLHILSLCLRGKTRILEVGCGFGLFACYFASRFPGLVYHGFDLDAHRITMATQAAQRLGLQNVEFHCADASAPLEVGGQYDAVITMDLLHHLADPAKHSLLHALSGRLVPGGDLVIKDITRHPWWKMAFTWALDVAMTRGFDMWYWDPEQFREAVDPSFTMESFPLSDWLPYPHIVYLFSKPKDAPC